MKKTIKKFYETFDFAKIITHPPKSIQNFLDGEIDFIKKYIKPNKVILEVGCGYGRLLEPLSKNAKKIVGIDFSKPLLDRAEENLYKNKNLELLLMDAKCMGFDDKTFDYVLCLDASFGNMPGIELDVLKQMERVCKKGGEVILSVFSDNAKYAQIENLTRVGLKNIKDDGKAIYTSEGFYSKRFSKEDLNELFKKVSLECKITKICSINYIAIGKKD